MPGNVRKGYEKGKKEIQMFQRKPKSSEKKEEIEIKEKKELKEIERKETTEIK